MSPSGPTATRERLENRPGPLPGPPQERSGAPSLHVVTADGARPVGAGLTIAGLGCARHELRLRSDGTDSAQRSEAPSTDADLGSLVVDLRLADVVDRLG